MDTVWLVQVSQTEQEHCITAMSVMVTYRYCSALRLRGWVPTHFHMHKWMSLFSTNDCHTIFSTTTAWKTITASELHSFIVLHTWWSEVSCSCACHVLSFHLSRWVPYTCFSDVFSVSRLCLWLPCLLPSLLGLNGPNRWVGKCPTAWILHFNTVQTSSVIHETGTTYHRDITLRYSSPVFALQLCGHTYTYVTVHCCM